MATSSRSKHPNSKIKKILTHNQIDSTQSQTPTSKTTTPFKNPSKSKQLMPGFTPVKLISPMRISTKVPSSKKTNFYQQFNPRNSVNKNQYKTNLRNLIPDDPLENIRKKIQLIFQEQNEKMTTIGLQCSQLDIELENQFSQIQDEYIEDLDQVYIDKMNKIKEINEKYDFDIYKTDYKDEDMNKKLKMQKEEEIKIIEKYFLMKKNNVAIAYKEKVDMAKEIHIKKKQKFLMGSKIIVNMKEKINRILNDPIEVDVEGKVIVPNT